MPISYILALKPIQSKLRENDTLLPIKYKIGRGIMDDSMKFFELNEISLVCTSKFIETINYIIKKNYFPLANAAKLALRSDNACLALL